MNDDAIEIGTFHSGLGIENDYFNDHKFCELTPIVMSLVDECKDLIKESGIYEFRLQVVKVKD